MKQVALNVPTLAFIVSTRALLAAGVALLAAEHLPVERRRTIGATLAAVGVATTLPALFAIVRGRRWSRPGGYADVGYDRRLKGVTKYPRRGDDIEERDMNEDRLL